MWPAALSLWSRYYCWLQTPYDRIKRPLCCSRWWTCFWYSFLHVSHSLQRDVRANQNRRVYHLRRSGLKRLLCPAPPLWSFEQSASCKSNRMHPFFSPQNRFFNVRLGIEGSEQRRSRSWFALSPPLIVLCFSSGNQCFELRNKGFFLMEWWWRPGTIWWALQRSHHFRDEEQHNVNIAFFWQQVVLKEAGKRLCSNLAYVRACEPRSRCPSWLMFLIRWMFSGAQSALWNPSGFLPTLHRPPPTTKKYVFLIDWIWGNRRTHHHRCSFLEAQSSQMAPPVGHVSLLPFPV